MLPESPGSPGISHTVKMLAIIEQWEVGSECHTDNSEKYLLLILFKLGLDIAVFYLCCWKLSTSFLSMCSLSVIIADAVLAVFFASVWCLGPEMSPVSACFLLAHASATYGALPLPMMFLGLLDYCLEDTYLCNQSAICKYLRNAVLILLGWVLAVIYSFESVKDEPILVDITRETMALMCKVEESTLITYFILVLFTVVLCVMMPFWSSIPQWLREADMLAEMREEQENQRSDLFISTQCTETKISEGYYQEETISPRPPLWLSLMLGFGMFWMPYLAVSVICLVFGFGVPAYITVNLLWLECANSLIMGVVFWAKANTLGPHRNIPKNVCLWHIYWHLSKGTQQQLPIAVFNPSKDNALFHV
ncbi:probable G-protein coupled receptor 160 [Dicentrarchus labrax]|uniref:Uncharacterized protein n=1 Tax=Dicentrarchus labrax TaxID=13489 RepID=A0A8C4EDX0_DICLA|nr:probable G-protein coupled receptor 160 [Dicentrarchus labrax]XP_051281438.1 probable G-protein coupled receptor 160 [Dicentrarchus labrax]XP_051281439.1 probable G-protein coupled receptor 160 [Dicentrarchus labrax]